MEVFIAGFLCELGSARGPMCDAIIVASQGGRCGRRLRPTSTHGRSLHLAMFALEALKPVLTTLLLPPVPWLLLILLGLRWAGPRPRLGRAAIVAGVVLIWLSACAGPARWLHRELGFDLPPLDAARLAAMRADEASAHTAILVLGGGMTASAEDPSQGELTRHSLERLRLGIRLARATGWPLAFSGGRGWAQLAGLGDSEAEAAQRTATQDFAYPLTWLEGDSRDTAENAALSLPLLRGHGVRRVLIVTHASHMPRAMSLFERAAAGGSGPALVAAPVANPGAALSPWLEWMPSFEGTELMRTGLREWLGAQVLRLSATPATSPEASTATQKAAP